MKDTLAQYQPISLEEMAGIRLMNRTDTKFVTTMDKLVELLRMASEEYLVQEIDGIRVANYYTRYFDTPDMDMYNEHHNGRCNRQKLRIRSYVDSQLDFLEVKTKDNHGRTKKKRIDAHEADSMRVDFIARNLRYDVAEMQPKIENYFNRITLVNKKKTERLTIDTNIRFHNIVVDNAIALDKIVIIELKRDGSYSSPVLNMLRELRIHPMGFSKYCMGMAMTDPTLRRNLFLPRITRINKLMRWTN